MIVGGFRKFRSALAVYLGSQVFSLPPSAIIENNNPNPVTHEADNLVFYVQPTQTPISTPGQRGGPRHLWRCRVHVVQRLESMNEADKLALQDALMTLTDEVEQVLTSGQTLLIDGRRYPMRIPEDTPRISMDSEAMSSHTFWASVEVELTE